MHLLQALSDGSLLLGDQEGLWHGRSGGGGWRNTGAPLNHMMVTCLAQTEGVMAACTTTLAKSFTGAPRGAWLSSDGGKRWRRASLPDLRVTYIASSKWVPGVLVAFAVPDSISGIGHGGIWASVNAGRTWKRINAQLGNATQPIGLSLLPGHPFTVIFATSIGLNLSTDGGKRWTKNYLQGYPVLSLTVSPIRPDLVFVGDANGLMRSIDSGVKWSRVLVGPPTLDLVSAQDSPSDLYGYASTTKPYVYRWRGRGRVLHGVAPSSGGLLAMTADPTDSRRVYVAWSFPLRVYESNDSGKSWRKIL